jgi:UDP-glucuronate 4-epimerase
MTTTRISVTGSAGFMCFHLAKLPLAQGHQVGRYDGMADYYDVRLKKRRHAMLNQHEGFSET